MGEVTNFCCCGSNVTAVKVFAGIFMSILGIIGFIMAVIWTLWHGIHEESLERNWIGKAEEEEKEKER